MSTFSLISRGRDSSTMPPYGEDTMFPTPSDLAELRRRLDEIDDRLHDLLIERAEIVSVVAAQFCESRRVWWHDVCAVGGIVVESRPCEIKENVDMPGFRSLPSAPELGTGDRSIENAVDRLAIASV